MLFRSKETLLSKKPELRPFDIRTSNLKLWQPEPPSDRDISAQEAKDCCACVVGSIFAILGCYR